jgi:MFS family permease
MGYAPIINMLSYTISNVGGTVSTLGTVYFAASMAEGFAMLFLIKKLKFDINTKLFLSIIFFILCSVTLIFGKTVYTVTAGMILKGTGYGLLMPTLRQIVYNNSPDKLRTTAQSLCDAVFCSLAGVLSSLYSGVMIDLTGGVAVLFGLCALFFIMSGILVLFKLDLFVHKKISAENAAEEVDRSRKLPPAV